MKSDFVDRNRKNAIINLEGYKKLIENYIPKCNDCVYRFERGVYCVGCLHEEDKLKGDNND